MYVYNTYIYIYTCMYIMYLRIFKCYIVRISIPIDLQAVRKMGCLLPLCRTLARAHGRCQGHHVA